MNILNRLIIVLSLVGSTALAQQEAGQGRGLWRATLLERTLTLGPAGRQIEVPVLFEKLTIDVTSEATQVELPFRGLLLVHVRAGELEIIAGDEAVKRGTGEFLIVPPGSRFGVRTEDDQVILASYLIGESYVDAFPDKPLTSRFIRPDGFYQDTVPNLRSREAYRIGDPENPVAVVRDFNVGPGLRTASYRFEGAAIIQVSSGQARTVVGGSEAESELGDSFGVSDGESFMVDNSQSGQPFKLRALILQK